MSNSSVEILRNLRIPVAGDQTLAADLYREAGSAQRPVIVVMLPYLKDGVAGSSLAWFLERFALAGFNVLLADLLGCGSSEGIAPEPFDGVDADHGVATVDWAASQEWCDGRVGFWGASYGGIMALRTAARRPAALRAIVALEPAINTGSDFVFPDGIRAGMSPAGLWPSGDLAMQLLPPLHRDAEGNWSRIWKRRLETLRPRLFDYLRRPVNDAHWQNTAIDIEAIAVPTLIVAGWRDFFCAPAIEVHRRLCAPKQLIVGPWAHQMPDQAAIAPLDVTTIAIRWWRRWLLDQAEALVGEPAITAYVQGLDRWQGFDAWPPRIDERNWTAADDGRLESGQKTAFTPAAVTVNHALGYRDHLWGFPIPGLPHEAHEDDHSGLCFTSAALDKAMVIAGAARVWVSVGRHSVGIRWIAARLSLVAADGSSQVIATGAVNCSAGSSAEIRLTDTCTALAAGQRLRLSIGAADFPRLWPQIGAEKLELDAAPRLQLPLTQLNEARALTPLLHQPGAMLAPLAIGLAPEWSVAEDLLTQTVTLTLGSVGTMYTPGREGTLELRSRVSASVSARNPGSSCVVGVARGSARWPGQPEIVVDGRLEVSATSAKVSAEIHQDGVLIFERSWLLEAIPS